MQDILLCAHTLTHSYYAVEAVEGAASLGEGAPGRNRQDDHGSECGIENDDRS